MYKRKALSLVEALLLIIVLLLLMLIMSSGSMGTCSSGNDLTARCAANLRAIGQGMYIYAQDDPQVFPAIGGTRVENDGLMRIFDPTDRTTFPTGDVPSPTVDLWYSLRNNIVRTDKYVCPWTNDEPDPALWPPDYYDFLSPNNLSYAYQYQHDPDRRVVGTSSAPDTVVLADSNPYIKGAIDDDIYNDRLGDGHGNSTNHRARSRGQNVLFQDSHVELEATPANGEFGRADAALGGYGHDNMYSLYDSTEPVTVDPGSYAPTEAWCNLGGRSDACLVP